MALNLLIVESPSKAKTIQKYLGRGFTVKASVGHIIDLPPSKIGVDVENGFKPDYVVIKGKKKIIDEIKKVAATVDHVYLAPDPDREGEAIAWHIAEQIKKVKPKPLVNRVLINEITKKGVEEALKHPTEINSNMFEAQQARRILDRLVGYQISPILWEKVRRGLSAGRVQSVAVRLVCEREEEIKNFKPVEYWTIEVKLEGSEKPVFKAHLTKKNGSKIEVTNAKESDQILGDLKKASFLLKEIQKKEQKRNAPPPFITSKLQQEAARKLGFTAKKTMMLAQRLYEGVEIDGEPVGLITYMRTDSVRTSPGAIEEVRGFINKAYGLAYLPDQANFFKTSKSAQDAHEAIRPTSMEYSPDKVKNFMEKDQARLYELIWKRFVASQMKPAVFDRTTFIIHASNYEFRANGSVMKFDGFITLYTESKDEETSQNIPDTDAEKDEDSAILPDLKEGETLKVHEYVPEQHFTEPPPRFTEASLVKELEEKGIGRPSTYASILSVIQEKKYVEKREKKFFPTDLGNIVNNLLVQNFPDILDATFTARMESELDDVEEGKLSWKKSLEDFYKTFSSTLSKAKVAMKDIKRQEVKTDIKCDKCGKPMVIKFGKNGEFLSCTGYPDCKGTREFKKDENNKIVVAPIETTDEVCDKCGSPMVFKRGRFGKFLACSKYPECKSTKPISSGIPCPDCGSSLVERRSKKGRNFFGCSKYPACKFASWDKPIIKPCPDCGSKYLVEKTLAAGPHISCPNKECGYGK